MVSYFFTHLLVQYRFTDNLIAISFEHNDLDVKTNRKSVVCRSTKAEPRG